MTLIRIIEPNFMSAPCAGCDRELTPNNSPMFYETWGSGRGAIYCHGCAVRQLATDLNRAERLYNRLRFEDFSDNPEEGRERRAIAANEVNELQRALTRAECAK